MENIFLYPLKFTPILKEKIWGGYKLKEVYKKKTDKSYIGESWELSSIKGNNSKVSNGIYKDITLGSLIKRFKSDLVGEGVYNFFGDNFPLLLKLIDANENLSIQLHPNNTLARKRHNSFGKTEMWYIMEAEANSELYAGLKKEITKEQYLKGEFDSNKILDIIRVEKVKQGDCFFIDAGTIHAIGKGIVLAEIQQTSDVTYRLYDWNRLDHNNKGRELHTELAIEAIDFTKHQSTRIEYDDKTNQRSVLHSCDFFHTNIISNSGITTLDLDSINSFIVYMCVEGQGEIILNNNSVVIKKGETILIPAQSKQVTIVGSDLKLLEIFIN